jgi:alkanesulfonate monooxygenase SsuD/methylene tetrahydromethanopterin reductase-like flavin-dependent oxidoreductase (luciferase family)
MELGIYTFGDLVPDPVTGKPVITPKQRMDDVLAMAKLADEAGLDVFGLGEHHTPEYTVSATATVLAAAAAVTKRIRLTSASTLLSTADPVRMFEEFATVDLISGGRAEIIAGRGAFIEGFALFGYELKDYDALFAEKLGLLMALNTSERVTWSGKFRPALHDAAVMPRPFQERLPLWIGALSPQSVVRAASLGLPLTLPFLGGSLPGYAQTAALYREAWQAAGYNPNDARVAVFSHMHVAETSQAARSEFLPAYAAYMNQAMLRHRGQGVPRAAIEQMASPQGTLLVGSPEEVVERLLHQHELLGNVRYVGQIDVGGQSFANVARGIELLATRVAPAVRKALAPL